MKISISAEELPNKLAAFEADREAVGLTRVWGNSYYVSLKSALHFCAAAPAKDEHPGYFTIIRLLITGLYRLMISKKAKAICFSADSGLYSKSSGNIGDRFLDLAGIPRAMHFVAIGSARGLPRTTCLFLNGIVTDNIITAPFSIILQRLLKPFLSVFKKRAITDLKEALRNYGILVSSAFLIDLIGRDHARYLIYLVLVKRIRPKRVFLVYAAGRSYIVNAAHRVGAEVIEIQHGDCGKSHKGFNYRCEKGVIAAPDSLIVRNEHWRNEAISAGYFKPEDVIIGKRGSGECPACRMGTTPDFLGAATGQRYLVFTSQPPVIAAIRKQIEDAYELLEKNDLYLVYKFHPADGASTIAELEKAWSGKSRIIAITKPVCLACLLRSATAHISFWSTCHHDAVEEIGHTYVLQFEGIHHYDEYCQQEPDAFRSVPTLTTAIRRIVEELE